MRKVYFVDSENVGDIWVPLLVSSQPEDEVLVFYTQKSPHMNYENVRLLKETDKEAVFIKCFEGSNALDFQLVSELGYRLCADGECAYVIVSNDTGYDAVVRYWSQRERPVSRLSGKECHRKLQERKRSDTRGRRGTARDEESAEEHSQEVTVPVEESATSAEAVVLEESITQNGGTSEGPFAQDGGIPEGLLAQDGGIPEGLLAQDDRISEDLTAQGGEEPSEESTGEEEPSGEPDTQSEEEPSGEPVAEEAVTEPAEEPSDAALEGLSKEHAKVVEALCSCVSKENLVDFHNALVAFLGEDEGKALYQEIKGNAVYTVYWSSLPKMSQKEKFGIYCRLVFDYSEPKEEEPEDFVDFLHRSGGKRKNLNSLRAAFQGHYGKDKGMRYYSLFKSHIKIMNRM